ncbi:acyl-CoA dehydrogenase family protein [Sphingopyxis sp. LC81]|uniref:acyl-CoA dehydrogenase family protein n=1 Tax=Sphingopyxis sp. LC81 TaxID=1502850 RepID=UPI000B0C3FEF|nr:acyl-CoA dehydrogenase family protein [Sphingopyxis sp. LC81]
MNEELSLLRDAASRFLAQEMVPQRERWEAEGIVDRASWRKMGEAGLLCASIPEAYGGAGGTYAHDIVIFEEMARAGLTGGLGSGVGVHAGIVAHYILSYGTEEQKLRWLPGLASGEKIGAIAMTEPGTGSDLQAVRTTAKRDGDDYVIDGSKTFISNGQNADLIIVVARTGSEAGAKSMSLIVVETDDGDQAQGFRRGRNLHKIGMSAQDTSELFFDGVRVPIGNLLGTVEGQGFTQLMVQLAWERLQLAIIAAINMEQAVAMTTTYTRERRAFGKTLFEFQNTQFKLAECATIATVARAFVDDCIVRLLAGQLDSDTAAKAKLWTAEQQCQVIDECLQLFGGYGYMTEYPIARLYADVRVGRIFGGTSEIMKTIIARSL